MSAGDSITSDEEDTYKEVSPCQRWHKKNVRLNDVPGIDALFQAMDMEEGVEVVWNEMNIPLVPLDDEGLVKLTEKLSKLSKIEHPNILKLFGSWYDKLNNKMVFITEYYAAGSLRKFTQRNHVNNKAVSTTVWKRWCRQVLSALAHLHSKEIAITHGFVTTDTVFIQHDGFVKLGSVAPSTIQDHIGTCSRSHRSRHRHYCAPEYGMSHGTYELDMPHSCELDIPQPYELDLPQLFLPALGFAYIRKATWFLWNVAVSFYVFVQKMVHRRSSSVDGKKAPNSSSLRSLGSLSSLDSISELPLTPDVTQTKGIQRPFSVDIYAFGIFCLSTLTHLEHTKENSVISLDDVKGAISTLSLMEHQSLINYCINPDSSQRPTAQALLSLYVFYEVPPLKVMCVNLLSSMPMYTSSLRQIEQSTRKDFHYNLNNEDKEYIPQMLDIQKINRDIKNGVYSESHISITTKALSQKNSLSATSKTMSLLDHSIPLLESADDIELEDVLHTEVSDNEEEHRLILTIRCQLNPSKVSDNLHLELEFQMSDNLRRIISTDIKETEDPGSLVDDIIKQGLLNKTDREMVLDSLVECLAT